LKRRWAALGASLGVLAASLLFPAVFLGLSGNVAVHREWAASLSRSTPPLLISQDNVSLLGFLSKWLGPSGSATAVFAVLMAGLALLTVLFILRGDREKNPESAEIALLLLLIPLVSPLGWDYTFLSALPAAAFIVSRWRALPRLGRSLLAVDFAVIALSLYDLLGRSFYASFMGWSVLTLCFLGLVPALFILRRKRAL